MANAVYLLSDMCRLCLNTKGVHDILVHDSLFQDVVSYTGVKQIAASNNLPHTICSICLYRVNIAEDLMNYTTKNDLYLQSLLNGTNDNTCQIAKPRVPLNLTTKPKCLVITETHKEVSPSSTSSECPKSLQADTHKNPQAKTAKISVRSLNDINKSMEPVNIEEKDKSPTTHKSSKITSTSGVTEKSHDSSSEKSEKPLPKKSRSSVRTSSNNDENKCESSSDKNGKQKTSRSSVSTSSNDENKISESSSEKGKKTLQKTSRSSVSTSSPNDEHKCETCSKTYATAKKLYLHRRSHSKSLFCPLDACSKSFVTKGDLQKHIRAHTGEKPYKCDLCDKSFAQNVTLKGHKEAVHVEKHT